MASDDSTINSPTTSPHWPARLLVSTKSHRPNRHTASHPCNSRQRRAHSRRWPWHRLCFRSRMTKRRGARPMQSYKRWSTNGGRLIDTASTYGDAGSCARRSHRARGLARQALHRHQARSRRTSLELKRSQTRLQMQTFDLLQFHNVRDFASIAGPNSRTGRAQGVCRYIGVTSTRHGDFSAIEAVLLREKPDFVQIDYSLDNREAEKARVAGWRPRSKPPCLPLSPSARPAVRAVHGKEIPDWARFCPTPGPIFPEISIGRSARHRGHPRHRTSCHITDNLGAMRGPLPDPDQRRRMVEFVEAL